MQEEISDHKLLTFFQKWLNQHITEYYIPNIRKCGTGIRKGQADSQSVFVIQNKKNAITRFDGVLQCHSAWACPKCTAEVMAKKATDIACAIDALKKQNQTATMITFTIPHTANMTCNEAFQVLLNTWRKFTKGGNRSYNATVKYTLKTNRAGQKGNQIIYKRGINPYGKFREDLKIIHNVRVFEFTHGQNGWHPHIHALFWAPDKNFNKIVDYEQSLLNHWWYCVKYETEKFWSKKIPKDQLKEFLEKVYADYKITSKDGHKSLYISRDRTSPDKPRAVSSSWYIAGWGGDKEITGNYKQKATHSDTNMTPTQIINKAFQSEGDEREKYLRLYAEYAQTTYKHRRCCYSTSGITKLIREYKQTKEYKERYKKKDTSRNWTVIYWFTRKQWFDILLEERIKSLYLRDDILEISKSPLDLKTRRQLIKQFLESYNIETQINFNSKEAKEIIKHSEDVLNKVA